MSKTVTHDLGPMSKTMTQATPILLLSRYDIRFNGGDAAGVANLAEMCQDSVSVVENSGLVETPFIAAHELRHW